MVALLKNRDYWIAEQRHNRELISKVQTGAPL